MSKKINVLAAIILTLCLLTVGSYADAKSKAEVARERAEVNQLSETALENLCRENPGARRVIKNCYAYATLSSSSVKVLVLGSAHGRGLAVNNKTGEKVYLHMKGLNAGLGVAAKEYDMIFLIDNKGAWDSFVAGKTRFSGSASATASDGVNGGSYEGAAYVADGVWMYQMTKKGLALEASIGGTKIYADKELNQY